MDWKDNRRRNLGSERVEREKREREREGDVQSHPSSRQPVDTE